MWFSKVFNQFSLNLAGMFILVRKTSFNKKKKKKKSNFFRIAMATVGILDFERYVLRARFLKNG